MALGLYASYYIISHMVLEHPQIPASTGAPVVPAEIRYASMYAWLLSDSATPWTVAHQAPLFMGFSRQEYWSGVPFSTPGDLPNPGIEPVSLATPALAGGFFTNCCPSREAHRDGGMTIFPRSKGMVIGLYEDAST